MGKLMVFIAAFKAGLFPLLAIAIVGVVLSIYYYFGWIKAAFFTAWRPPLAPGETEPAETAATPVGLPAGLALGVLAAGSVVFGFFQGPIAAWLLTR
jgi:NADH-quinone oxidoreductase subunit N